MASTQIQKFAEKLGASWEDFPQFMEMIEFAKSFSDAALGMFRKWLEYFGSISNVPVIAVPPQYTSQICSSCGKIVKKSLSTRTHVCSCGLVMDRDLNAAKNILAKAFGLIADNIPSTVGHTGIHASGEETSTLVTQSSMQASSLKEESTGIYSL